MEKYFYPHFQNTQMCVKSFYFIFSGEMSFYTYKSEIEVGDTVVLYFGFDNLYQLRVEKGKVHQSKYGALKHDDLIGQPFGKHDCTKGWIYVLYPTPELWTKTLPHRTQILYTCDICTITLQLDLKPGSIVIESGTGSGSLSHAIIRTVAPTGHLYTFDFHEQRCETAAEEFKDHGIGAFVTSKHRDVCATGFDMYGIADAVFLDLPAPWSVIPFAKKSLKKQGGRICSFSPCIEQVQRVCETLESEGFTEITTMECLSRPFDVRSINMPLPDLGWGPGNEATVDVGDSFHLPVIGKIEDKKDLSNDTIQPPINADTMVDDKNVDKPSGKRTGSEEYNTSKKFKGSRGGKPKQQHNRDVVTGPSFVYKTGLPPNQMPGHTGYLTFASLYPQ